MAQTRQSLFYVALGDSLTVGIGAVIRPGFVKQYRSLAKECLKTEIHTFNFGRHGATTKDLVEKIKLPVVRLAIKHAHVFTISIGGNDLRKVAKRYFQHNDQQLMKRTIHQAYDNIGQVIAQIKKIKRGKQDYIIRLINVYNPYPKLAVAEHWVQTFNQGLLRFEDRQVKVVDVFHMFKGKEKSFLSLDGLHPNGKGYALIARQLHLSGCDPLHSPA
jgi:lysophospholipase L1-like esterase